MCEKIKKIISDPQWIMAITTVSTLVFAIISNNETTQTIKRFEKTISRLTTPFVQFEWRDWIWKFPDRPPSCENLPVGADYVLRNTSLVPVRLTTIRQEFFCGKKKLDDITKENGINTILLSPGGISPHSMNQSENFQKFFSKDSDCPLRIEIEADVETLVTHEKFKYVAKPEIRFNCANRDLTVWMPNDEFFQIE